MDDNSQSPHNDTNSPKKDIGQSDKGIPTRIEVKNMLLEAKLDINQKLITVVLALLALLGVILPFVLSIRQDARVDRAIDRMETSFKELAGKQLRKPNIICKNGNELLLNSVFHIMGRENAYFIQIHNEGDGVAGPIDAYIYLNDPNSILNSDVSGFNFHWIGLPSEEPGYAKKYSVGGCEHLSPQEILDIPFCFPNTGAFECRAMLKVFYGELTPIKIPFVFQIR